MAILKELGAPESLQLIVEGMCACLVDGWVDGCACIHLFVMVMCCLSDGWMDRYIHV